MDRNSRARSEQIRIEQRSAAQEGTYGTKVTTWSTFLTAWAEVLDLPPAKAMESQAQNIRIASRPVRVRLDYLDGVGVTSAMRVVLIDRGDRLLKITGGPAELGRREQLELLCEEFSTSGEAS